MLYRTLKRMIERGHTAGMAEKLDIFYAADKLTEAQYAELTGMLVGEHVYEVLLSYPDVIGTVLPEVQPAAGFDQHTPYHLYDVWGHTALAVQSVRSTTRRILPSLMLSTSSPLLRTSTGTISVMHSASKPSGTLVKITASLSKLKVLVARFWISRCTEAMVTPERFTVSLGIGISSPSDS